MKLKNPLSGWKSNSFILKMIACYVTFTYILVLLLAIYSLVFNRAFISQFDICFKEDKPLYQGELFVIGCLVVGSLLLAIVLSVALDIFGLWKLQQIEKNQPNQEQKSVGPHQVQPYVPPTQSSRVPDRRIIDEMPIRSSLINTLFLIPYLFIIIGMLILGRDFKKKEKRLLMAIPYLVISIFRTLLVATLTFRKNGANRQRNADEEREQLRMIEIEDALRKRRIRNEGTYYSNFSFSAMFE